LLVHQGSVSGPIVLTITLNPATGAYTVTQNLPIHHDLLPADENNQGFSVTYVVTDGDTDTATGTIAINVDDDTPVVTTSTVAHVDEDDLSGADHPGNSDVVNASDDLADSSPVSASGSFGISFGADGAAASGAIANVTLTTPVSSDGVAVDTNLTQVGNDWFGMAGDEQVFKLSFDTATGQYTFTLLDNLTHPLNSLEDNLTLSFSFTAKDGDGDTVTGSLSVDVDDDMPVLTGAVAAASVDEPAGWSLTGQVAEIEGNNTLATAHQIALSDFRVGPNPDVGNAALPWVAITGQIDPGNANDVDFFRFHVEAGETITFDIDHGWDGAAVDTVLELFDSAGNNLSQNDDASTLFGGGGSISSLDSYLTFTAAVSGDYYIGVSAYANFAGSGPTYSGGAFSGYAGGDYVLNVSLDTTRAPTVTETLDLAPLVSFGADSPGVFGLTTFGPTPVNFAGVDGPITVSSNGSVLTGSIGGVDLFTLTVSPAGISTFTLLHSIEHLPGSGDADLDFSAFITARDNDGDGIALPAGRVVFSVNDDVPTAGENATVLLDDDALAGGNPAGIGDDADSANAAGTLAHDFGNDGGSIAFSTSGAPAGFVYVASGNNLLVHQGSAVGPIVLTITLNPSTGAYTVTQNLPIHHDLLPADENNQGFSVTYVVTDGDTDTATGTLTINVDDDTPVVTVTATNEAGTVLTTQDADTIGLNSDSDSSTADFSGVFGATPLPGADGLGSTSSGYLLNISVPQGTYSGLDSNGVQIHLFALAGVIYGSTTGNALDAAANAVFTITVTPAGIVTLTQLAQIDHTTLDPSPTGAPFADHLAILGPNLVNLTYTVTITDGDGDQATDSETIDLSGNIQFTDDGPSIEISADTTVGAATDTSDAVTEDGPNLSGAISLVEGADEDATLVVSLTGATGGPLSFTLNGTASTQSATVTNGTDVLGVLTVAITAGGAATWTFDPSLDVNNSAGDPSFTFTATVTDADGDSDSDSHTITVTDGLTATATNLSLTVQESDIDVVGTTPAQTDEVDDGAVTFTANSDNITDVFFGATAGILIPGLDNAVSIVWTGQNTDTLTGTIGGTPVIQLTITGTQTAAAGGTAVPTITATLLSAFPHENNVNVNTLSINGIQVVATESDGETATSTVTVTVTDDLPIAAPDTSGVNEGALLTVAAANGVLANDTAGADGYDTGPSITTPVPLGNEVRINTFTGGDQSIPTVTALAGGGYVVTWTSLGQDGDGHGVYGQRYDAAGVPSGGELHISTATFDAQLYSSVAALANGGFVVTWTSYSQDGGAAGVYGQRYDASGVTDGLEFRINTETANYQLYSSVAALSDGGFVVTWSSLAQDGSGFGIYGQRYNAAGAAFGGEFHVSTATAGDQAYASVAALSDGGFVVTWSSDAQDGSGFGIYGQRYNAAGAAVGAEFHISTTTANHQAYSSVAALSDGGFVVTWSSLGQDGDGWGVYGQRYNAAGAAVGGEFHISTATANDQFLPSVTSLADGGFVVSWNSIGQDGDGYGVYGQRFDVAGNAVGSEFRISQSTSGYQLNDPEVGGFTLDQLGNGNLVAVWYGEPSWEVYARQFDLGHAQAVIGVRAENGDATTPVLSGVDAAIAGDFGTLTLHGDGSYSYQSNPNAVPPPGANDVFVYTIRDGDGDLSTTTLTIAVNDANLIAPADADVIVDEAALDLAQDGADLAPGTVTGSLPGLTTETDATNQLNATGGSGTLTYALVGSPTGTYGTIQINANGSYVYTLRAPHDNATVDDGVQTISGLENFNYSVTDSLGNTTTGTITVSMIDDVPSVAISAALADPTPLTDTVAEDGLNLSGTISLVEGADQDGTLLVSLTGATGGPLSFTLNGIASTQSTTVMNGADQLGVLTVAVTAGGAASWTFNPSSDVNNTAGDPSFGFTATITDADGDTASASHTITITDGANPTAGTVTVALDEAAINAIGSNPSSTAETDADLLPFTAGSDNIVSFSNDLSGLLTEINGAPGQDLWWSPTSTTQITGYLDAGLTQAAIRLDLVSPGVVPAGTSANVSVTATLLDNLPHPVAGLAQTISLGSAAVIATDSDGDTAIGTVNVTVKDDVPTVTSVAQTGHVEEAGVLTLVDSTFGNLGIDWNADDNNVRLEIARDGGGNRIFPAGLSSGGVALDYTVRLAFNGIDEELVGFRTGDTAANPVFVMALNSLVNPAFALILMQPLDHSGAGADTLPIQFSVTGFDSDGDPVSQTFTINVLDDVPVAVADTDSVTEGVGNLATGNVVTGGTDAGDANSTDGVADTAGSDGFNGAVVGVAAGTTGVALMSAGTVGTTVSGTFGVLTLNANGSYSYNPNENRNNAAPVTDTFTYTIRDGDGDLAFTTLAIAISDGTNPSVITNAIINVDEEGLGNVNATGSAFATSVELGSGTVTFQAGSDNITSVAFTSVAGITADVNGVAGADIVWTLVGPTQIRGTIGGIAAIQLDLVAPSLPIAFGTTGSATVNVTLLDNFPHPNANGQNVINLTGINVVATDTDGDSISATVAVNVTDDVPDVDFAGETTVNENGIPDSAANGTYRFLPGADGALSGSLTIDVNGSGAQTITAAQILDNGHTLVTSAGTLVLSTPDGSGNGTWTFTPVAVTATATVNISVTLTDGDGDSDTDTHSFTVVNVNSPLVFNAVTGTVEEEHGLPGGIEDTTDLNNLDTDENLPNLLNTVTNAISGNFTTAIASGADGALTFSFVSLGVSNPAVQTVANGPLTSGGKPVLYDIQGTNLIGYYNSDGGTGDFGAGDTTVFTVTLSSAGVYSFTLNAPIDHPLNSVEDAIAINLGGRVQVVDAGGPAADNPAVLSNVSITVIDDVPTAEINTRTVAEGTVQTVDVQFIVDMSGSMFTGTVANVPTFSDDRAGLARYAMLTLLQSNEQIQNVQFVTFGTSAAGSVWMDRDDAIAYVNSGAPWSNRSGTDYDLALSTAMSSYASARVLPAGDQTFVYFLSDGEPVNGAIDADGSGSNVSIAEWETHITTNGIDQVFALGIGAAPVDALNPIAYPKVDPPGAPVQYENVILVSTANAGDLGDTFQDLLGATSSVSGNILLDDPSSSTGADSFGADGGRILSIVVGGITYTYDPVTADITASSGPLPPQNTPMLSVTTALGGTFTFYFAASGPNAAGSWSYLTDLPGSESFSYVLRDGDGDQVSSALNITITPVNDAPQGQDKTVTFNEDATYVLQTGDFGFSDPNDTPANTLLAVRITTLPANGTLFYDADGAGAGSPVAVTANQSITAAHIAAGHLYFVPAANANGTGYAFFTFQVQDNGGTANSGVDLDPTPATMTVNVTAVNDGPTFSGLDNAPSHTEGGAAVVLDSNALLADIELDAANNYSSATLTLARNGGASSQDVFGAIGTLSFSGANVVLSAVTVGTFTNVGGTLVITFNGNATSARVDSVLQQLTYANNSDTPPASVQVNYTFSDGNAGAQGTGGALNATGSITVGITPQNDAPVVSNVTATETSLSFTITDPDSSSFNLVNSPALFATAFGNPSLVVGLNTLSPTQQGSVVTGTLQVTDGTTPATVIGLYLGTSTGNTATAPIAGSPNAMYGFGGNDNLTGGTAADFIFGGIGDDTLTGGLGADTINGGDNNDTINLAHSDFVAGESIDGGNGTDSIVLTDQTAVDFTTGTIAGVETLTGSSGADAVTMSAQQWGGFTTINLANDSGGNDVLNVQVNGTVDISAGTAPSVSNVEVGNLTGTGNADTITLTGAQLNAILISGTIDLGLGTDTINLTSHSSDLVTLGNTSNASIVGVEVFSAATATGTVTFDFAAQSEGLKLVGSRFDDTITGGTGGDIIIAGGGNDLITGGGSDVIDGGTGRDQLNLQSNLTTTNDAQLVNVEIVQLNSAGLVVNLSNQTEGFEIYGVAGTQTITGGNGNDLITAGAGADIVNGGGGTDTFVITDVVTGSSDSIRVASMGSGNDTGQDTITGFNLSSETLRIVASNVGNFAHLASTSIGTAGAGTSGADATSYTILTGVLSMNGDADFNDNDDIVVTFASPVGSFTEANFEARLQYDLTGTSGNDTIITGALNDTIMGLAGFDFINSGGGSDVIIIGSTVGTSSDSKRVANGGVANDEGQDNITGFDLTNDTLRVVATNVSSFVHGTDTAIGTAGLVDDGTIGSFAVTTGLIELNQTTNNDWDDAGDIAVTFITPTAILSEANFEARLQYDLTGTSGNNTLTGGSLADTFTGGAGNDTLNGGGGIDTMRYNETGTANQDAIGGYTGTGVNHDILDVSSLLDAAFDPSLNVNNFVQISISGADALVRVDTTGSGSFSNTGNVATLTGYGTLGSIVSVYFEGAEHQVQVA
jgi:T1SS-143 domain-containing protein